jgi:hypothetical protein
MSECVRMTFLVKMSLLGHRGPVTNKGIDPVGYVSVTLNKKYKRKISLEQDF